MVENIKIAISSDFFAAFSKLPQAQQSKVSKFITNFQKNPTMSGINYEKINNARDPNMRSVRIDQAYRAIVLRPEQGNIYLLLWVDHHDNAYDWALRHKCSINTETGAIQVYEAEVATISEETPTEAEAAGLFDHLKDRELIRLGVPEELVDLTRTVRTEDDLDNHEERLPVEAYEGLFMILAGSKYDEIINEREAVAAAAVDTSNFDLALQRLASLSKFVVVDDDLELQAMLAAPLEQWRVFLHPSQRKLAEGTKNGAVRVLGGAGTGKTVVAIHRAKWLAENVATDTRKVLFTTFTRNLATDIEENLRSICTPDLMERIEVINLDRWVSQFLRKRKYEYSIIYGNDGQFWDLALDITPSELNLPDAFYKEEWQKVIQPQSIETLEQYKRASRIGRGTRLSRADRVKVWTVFEEYRNGLNRQRKREVDDAYRDAAALLAGEPQPPCYCAVVVDEAQDMSTQAFKLIRQIMPEGPNDIFVVGDGHQRIYGRNKVVLSHCDINIRGRSKKLRINYRTTEEIRRAAVNLLEGFPVDDLDGGSDTNEGYKSLTHGEAPTMESFQDADEQARFIANLLKTKQENGERLGDICIVSRIKKELEVIDSMLKESGIAAIRVTSEKSDHARGESVRLATMHRVKGLEFEEVILASVNEGLVPFDLALAEKGDPVEQRQADMEERALLYVAMTRAKSGVILLSYGEPSPYIG